MEYSQTFQRFQERHFGSTLPVSHSNGHLGLFPPLSQATGTWTKQEFKGGDIREAVSWGVGGDDVAAVGGGGHGLEMHGQAKKWRNMYGRGKWVSVRNGAKIQFRYQKWVLELST
jgi:hypothetical protein